MYFRETIRTGVKTFKDKELFLYGRIRARHKAVAYCVLHKCYLEPKDIAEKNKAGFQAIKITSADSAKEAPTAHTSFTMFYNGEFVTHEILSEKKFQKFCDENIL